MVIQHHVTPGVFTLCYMEAVSVIQTERGLHEQRLDYCRHRVDLVGIQCTKQYMDVENYCLRIEAIDRPCIDNTSVPLR